MHHIASTAHIEKVSADRFHYVLKDKFRRIDELIDDAKLLGLLSRESLTDSGGQPISAEEIVQRADALKIGQKIEVSVVQRVA